jgi:hypothetical protein
MKLLRDILGRTRQSGSEGLRVFNIWLKTYVESLGHAVAVDGYGNLWVVTDSVSETLFTCHTDTVHHGVKTLMQGLELKDGILRLGFPHAGYVLGADDGAGCWLLLKMIESGVRGTFVFYQDEEIGGLGSEWSVQNEPERYGKFKRAVAFDRKGKQDVITHQWGGRCCSQAFAESLCKALDMGHRPDDTGSFTDTANLTELVPECTNVSVGYENAHTSAEYLDTVYLNNLLQKLKQVGWEGLPVGRNPEVRDDPYDYYDWGGGWMSDDDSLNFDELGYILKVGQPYVQELVYGRPEDAARLLLWCAERL